MGKLSLKEGILIFIATYIITYGLGLNITRLVGIDNMEDYFNSYTFLVVQGFFSLTLITLTYFAMKRRGLKLRELLRPGKATLLLGLGLGILLLILEHGVTAVTEKVLGPSETQEVLLKAATSSLKSFSLLFFLGALVAPLSEEIYFRGYMFRAMRQRLSPCLAAVLNGIYFGISHMDAAAFLAVAILGSILAYAYEKKDSLFLVVIAHAFVNATAIVAAYMGYRV